MQLLELVQTTILCTVKVGSIAINFSSLFSLFLWQSSYLDNYHWLPTIFLFGKSVQNLICYHKENHKKSKILAG